MSFSGCSTRALLDGSFGHNKLHSYGYTICVHKAVFNLLPLSFSGDKEPHVENISLRAVVSLSVFYEFSKS